MSFRWFLQVSLPRLCTRSSLTRATCSVCPMPPTPVSSVVTLRSYYKVGSRTPDLTDVSRFVLSCVGSRAAWRGNRREIFASVDENHDITLLEFPSSVLPSTSPAWTPLRAVLRAPSLSTKVVKTSYPRPSYP